MLKLWKFFELAYLILAIIFFIETVLNWNEDREKAYLFGIFGIVLILFYFFRRRFRKRREDRFN